MAKLMDIVMPVLLLGGGLYIFSKRCELLGVCGEIGSDPIDGSIEEVAATEEEATGESVNSEGQITDTATQAGSSGKSGCCECSMQGDRVKCRKNGGAWFNPPAVGGVSNDQSVGLSLQACNADCSSVVCNSGAVSVNGKCVPKTSGGSKGSGGSGSSGTRTSKPANTPRNTSSSRSTGGGAPAKGSTSARPRLQTSGSARIGAGAGARYTQQQRSYFVDPNYIRSFRLYHRIAN